MKQKKILSALMVLGSLVFVSCNNDSDTSSANADSTTVTNTETTTTNTSTTDDAAYAEQIESNSAKGRYINPKTGKAYKKLSVNRTTGEITDENNEPVWRYVDSENWWVYGLDDSDWTWRHVGEAKMDKDQLTYQDESGNWVNYDKRWKTKDADMGKTWKAKSGDTKIKFDKDGDIKLKDESGSVKYDADDNKVKTDSSK
jgi:hypothetical protein